MRILTGIAGITAMLAISCGHMGHNMTDANTSPTGTWTNEVSAQGGMSGHSINDTTKTTVIIDQHRFKISAETISSGTGSDITMPFYERVGTWAMHGDTIRFDPDTCKVYDSSSDSMVKSDTCRTDMMRGLINHADMMSLHGMSMMDGDTATMIFSRK